MRYKVIEIHTKPFILVSKNLFSVLLQYAVFVSPIVSVFFLYFVIITSYLLISHSYFLGMRGIPPTYTFFIIIFVLCVDNLSSLNHFYFLLFVFKISS